MSIICKPGTSPVHTPWVHIWGKKLIFSPQKHIVQQKPIQNLHMYHIYSYRAGPGPCIIAPFHYRIESIGEIISYTVTHSLYSHVTHVEYDYIMVHPN